MHTVCMPSLSYLPPKCNVVWRNLINIELVSTRKLVKLEVLVVSSSHHTSMTASYYNRWTSWWVWEITGGRSRLQSFQNTLENIPQYNEKNPKDVNMFCAKNTKYHILCSWIHWALSQLSPKSFPNTAKRSIWSITLSILYTIFSVIWQFMSLW